MAVCFKSVLGRSGKRGLLEAGRVHVAAEPALLTEGR